MAKIRKEKKNEVPAISTASLPDIIFMLLFFFMAATTMREVTLKVQVSATNATEIQKIEDKSLVSYIYIGKPQKALVAQMGDESRIQLNDKFAEPSDLHDFISTEVNNIADDKKKKHIVSLKVDKNTKMGIVSDVKQELRKANALKINYSARGGYEAGTEE